MGAIASFTQSVASTVQVAIQPLERGGPEPNFRGLHSPWAVTTGG